MYTLPSPFLLTAGAGHMPCPGCVLPAPAHPSHLTTGLAARALGEP